MKDQLELEAMQIVSTNEGDATVPLSGDARWHAGLPAVTVGRLAALAWGSAPLVDFPTNNSGELVTARTVVELNDAQVGSEVTLMFEEGEVTRPIIMGVLRDWHTEPPQRLEPMVAAEVQVQHDADSLLLTAAKEITLECGKASITLTSAGKVLLRGAYLLSRSSGVNRIKGGSVQIN